MVTNKNNVTRMILAFSAFSSIAYSYSENGQTLSGALSYSDKYALSSINKSYGKDDINVNNPTRYKAYREFKEKDDSGVFLGIDGGGAYAGAFGFNVGANLGYSFAVNKNFGLKYYIDYRYIRGSSKRDISTTIGGVSASTTADLLLQAHMASANLDFYVRFNGGFGFFAGVGLGYFGVSLSGGAAVLNMTLDGKIRSNFAFPANIGLTYSFNRFEISLFSRIPILEYEYHVDGIQEPLSGRVYIINAGISYLF